MELLVLGGTEFVGRAVVEDAVARGWGVTVFNRGSHGVPPGVRALRGDRVKGEWEELGSGEWDAVVDTWSGDAGAVRDAVRVLGGRAGRYGYVSTRSVYAYPTGAGMDESAALVDPEGDDYAAIKRAGEVAVVEGYGDAALLLRAGLILGPYENVGRLPWWLNRIARGGEVLAPGPRELGLQYIDVRDLAAWSLDALAKGLGGPYNLFSPPAHTTTAELLETCVRVTGSDAVLRWVAPEVVEAAGIEPWTQLPVWLPPGELYDSLHLGDVSKALGAGLRCRPVGETVADTWRWLTGIGGVAPQRPDRAPAGLDPEVERRVLDALD